MKKGPSAPYSIQQLGPVHSGLFFFGQSINLIKLALFGVNDRFAVVFELYCQCRVNGPLGMVLVLF